MIQWEMDMRRGGEIRSGCEKRILSYSIVSVLGILHYFFKALAAFRTGAKLIPCLARGVIFWTLVLSLSCHRTRH